MPQTTCNPRCTLALSVRAAVSKKTTPVVKSTSGFTVIINEPLFINYASATKHDDSQQHGSYSSGQQSGLGDAK
jgi:hypothetical protein